ncbi:MAG: sensor histidine kinase [Pseudomonadota bacterium]
MLSGDLVLVVCLAYVALLFWVAFFVDAAARQGRMRWLRAPWVYTLSISVYCTSWTFYGAVGSAARNGLEFVTIYLGPTLVFVGWWFLLRKLVRIGREQRVTSIADLISARFGKSPSLAVMVTLLAVVAITPYIALQLQAVTSTYMLIAGGDGGRIAFWAAVGLAVFTILFGTRTLDANERHHGVVAAIAFEAVVKCVALVAVGAFVVWGLAGGVREVFAGPPDAALLSADEIFGPRWAAMIFLSAAAIICLPRQFQVTVVENIEERHLATAAGAVPLYLFVMTLFIAPIALVGLAQQPGGNPDLYVLTLPLEAGREELALLAFIGGFSSATSMVIVAAIAVSTMVSNHVVMPLAINFLGARDAVSGDVRQLLLNARRISIAGVLALGFLYYRLTGGSELLAQHGLIAFVGVAQFLPSLLGGLFWRGATRRGAQAGLAVGAALWAYTCFLPSFEGALWLSAETLANGPWGIAALRPEALFGLDGLDPLSHSVLWSVGLNALTFILVSSLTEPATLERVQGAAFVDAFHAADGAGPAGYAPGAARADELFVLAQRILGADPARRLFEDMARAQGRASGLPEPTDATITRLERVLAGSIGAASAHAMIGRLADRRAVGISDLMEIADETQRLMATSRALSEKTAELERAAAQLREANQRLRSIDAQKDVFLTQVSHELRTPMTSIRSFAEILSSETVSDDDAARFIRIIHDESQRLTRLLDEILDVSRLEAGSLDLPLGPVDAQEAIASALDTVSGLARNKSVRLIFKQERAPIMVLANADRLRQVLINLLSNAVKYNAAARPSIEVRLGRGAGGRVLIDVVDNGGGVSREEASRIFEKFVRGDRADRDQGAGLGLPISRALMRMMSGDLAIVFERDGRSFFRCDLAAEPASAAPEARPDAPRAASAARSDG